MSLKMYYIGGMSGNNKIVSLWHTNKHLRNFHYTLDKDLRLVYDNWPEGDYIFPAGYQNGYYEIGITCIRVKNLMGP